MADEHRTLRLAEQLADTINAANFGWSAELSLVPTWTQEDLAATLAVKVVPQSHAAEPAARRVIRSDERFWLVLCKPLAESGDFDLDEAREAFRQMQSLEEFLQFRSIGDYGWTGLATEQICDYEHLYTQREFYAVLSVSYQAHYRAADGDA